MSTNKKCKISDATFITVILPDGANMYDAVGICGPRVRAARKEMEARLALESLADKFCVRSAFVKYDPKQNQMTYKLWKECGSDIKSSGKKPTTACLTKEKIEGGGASALA